MFLVRKSCSSAKIIRYTDLNEYSAVLYMERVLGCCGVVLAQWSERRQLRSEALGLIPSGCPGILFLC